MAVRNTQLGGTSYLDTGSSTLSAGINNAVTVIPLVDSSSFKTAGWVQIDDEVIAYTGNSGNTLTGCTRGSVNTTAASHLIGLTVKQVEPAFNTDLNDTFDAIATYAFNAYSAALPLGSVIAWHKDYAGATLPSCYLECNGQTITDSESPLFGLTMPAMNGSAEGTKLFARGNTTSGTIGGSTVHNHNAVYQYSKAGTVSGGSPLRYRGLSDGTSIPPYFEARWIMRIK